jgi:TonB family protein
MTVTNPEWLRKPPYDQLAAVYPVGDRKGGQATVGCKVTKQGILHDCTVIDERPYGVGFGQAIMRLTSQFIMKPAMKDGKAVEAVTGVTVVFKTNGDKSTFFEPLTVVLSDVVWLKAPTVSDVLAELDKKTGDKFADPDDSILVQCALDTDSGKPSKCDVVNASAGMEPYSGVARSLAAEFQADPKLLKGYASRFFHLRVNLVFRFPDMHSQGSLQRRLGSWRWARSINPSTGYPEAATKAGLNAGTANLDCVVNASGELSQCQVTRESVPGVGLGQAALQMAPSFAVSPWNDGLPVEGAHARFQLSMAGPDRPSADAANNAAPTPATKP